MPTSLTETLHATSAAVADLGDTAAAFARLDDAALVAAARTVGELAHCVDRYAALAAGEVARRSRFELGYQGMAQRTGFATTVAMVQSLTGVGKQEASRLIETGTLLAETEAAETARAVATDTASSDPESASPDGSDGLNLSLGPPVVVPEWRDRLGRAISDGTVSVESADAIRRVLSDITDSTSPATDGTSSATDPTSATSDGEAQHLDATLTAAVDELIAGAPGLTPEQLFRRARQVRDVIDVAGIEKREKKQRDLRSVRTWWDATGMHCGSWRLPPEDGVLVAEAFGQILSPRRGGPRFVDQAAKATAAELLADPRSDEQIAADALVGMIRLAVEADPGTMFGRRRPAVRVVVTADQLRTPQLSTAHQCSSEHPRSSSHPLSSGPNQPADPLQPAGSAPRAVPPPDLRFGYLESRPDPVSGATIDRYLCDSGTVTIGFDTDGQCMNVGRDARLFTGRQRLALTVRDGGCRFPGCDRPPSSCEAHHINPWAAKGRTDTADGILLCRRHHMLLHNNHWTITRTNADYQLTPPRNLDPTQQPIPMPTHSPITHQLARRRAGR